MNVTWTLPTEQARTVFQLIEDALEFDEQELTEYAHEQGCVPDLKKFREEQAILHQALLGLRAVLERS